MNTVSQEDKMSRGQGNQVLNKLEDAGLDKELAQLIVGAKDNRLAEKLVEFVEAYAFAIREQENEDLYIMGKMFGYLPGENRQLCFSDPSLTVFYNREKPRRHNLHIKF
jgi:hypothetical protein